MSLSSRFSRSAPAAWVAAVAVAAFPTWELWRERRVAEELVQTHGESGEVYGYVCQFGSGSTLSPLAPLRRDLEAVEELTTEWGVAAFVVLLGLVACLGRRDPGVTGRRVAGVLVLIAVVEPLASLYGDRGICREAIPLLSADWFKGVAGGWGITQLCLLAAAALVLAASREMRSVAAGEPDGSPAGTVWRRPAAALVDYLIIGVVLGAVGGPAWPLIGMNFKIAMGAGLLERADTYLFRGSVRPADLVVVIGLYVYCWVQHTVWGRTLGKRLLGIRVIDARTGGRLGAGKAALRTLAFPLVALVPGVGLWFVLVDGLWMLLDGEGRVLHDRLLGAAVVRDRVTEAQPQT
ncbi:RDD family protein [Nonomuraea muscovyensis]|uniref:RDD family protein n=1 Tax=Nonomuraea muscovyensis TaxID=1124761 RepID=UPI0033C69923